MKHPLNDFNNPLRRPVESAAESSHWHSKPEWPLTILAAVQLGIFTSHHERPLPFFHPCGEWPLSFFVDDGSGSGPASQSLETGHSKSNAKAFVVLIRRAAAM
jgi:hypothetical protein